VSDKLYYKKLLTAILRNFTVQLHYAKNVLLMLEYLFGSKTRFKLLKIFFRDPIDRYFVRQLGRFTETQINAVRRELDLLVRSGIIMEIDSEEPTKKDRDEAGGSLRKYYTLNVASTLYPELKALLLKDQLMSERRFVNELKDKIGTVDLIVLSGRFTGDHTVQTDILLVGAIREGLVSKIVSEAEKEFGFEIRYTIMTKDEFVDRRRMMDKFLYSIFEADHLVIEDRLKMLSP